MTSFSLGTLVKTSRPRFWLYTLGPFLLGYSGGIQRTFPEIPPVWLIIAWALWLTLPANLIIYGINDLYDEETDKANAKKAGYETRIEPATRPRLKAAILVGLLLGSALLIASALFLPAVMFAWVGLGFAGLLSFGHQYSATPIRAKARPFFDSLFNILYVFPVLIGWGLSDTHSSFPWLLFAAGTCWCMAMHAFSAIPDIEADRSARLSTIATRLGKQKALAFCTLLYGAACLLTIPWLGALSFVGLAIYMGMMLRARKYLNDEKGLFAIYKHFPLLNMAVGFALWLFIVLR